MPTMVQARNINIADMRITIISYHIQIIPMDSAKLILQCEQSFLMGKKTHSSVRIHPNMANYRVKVEPSLLQNKLCFFVKIRLATTSNN